MEPQLNLRAPKMSNNGPNLGHHKQDKTLKVPTESNEAPAERPTEQPTSGINLRKQVEPSQTQHNLRVKNVVEAQQPLSPASYCGSMEMPPYRPGTSPNTSFVSKGKVGESSHSLKTSTELLKVLNRIWSLEEKHALDMSLVKTLKKELDESQKRIQELLQAKKRDQSEIDSLLKQITEYKVARKKERDRVKDAVKLVEDKLEDELKLRRNSEKLHHKLAKELSEIKSSFSNAFRDLERERKARTLLEDLCDEFAKGIRDYEQEVRFMKQKFSKGQIGQEGNDRLILHISEAWLDERKQMKLADARDVSEKQSALDKLCFEVESFLQAKLSGNSAKDDYISSRSPLKRKVPANSFESLHLNEPASAPWNRNDEDESISTSNRCSQRKVSSLKQADISDSHVKETAKPKPVKKKVQSRKVSDPSSSHVQLEEPLIEREHQPMNVEESTKSRMGKLYEMSNPRMPEKGEMMQRSSREGKSKITEIDAGLQDATTRNPPPTSEDKYENSCIEGFFDPSTFAGPPSPVKKWTWTSEVSAADPDICESSSRWPKIIKSNTLKMKLMEARIEGQQSRARTSKGSSKVD
ncbi:uncharacterized protein At5g41620 isoform X1 [Sesamum indicum]|uniref:Uncharacterized protein At5g41620 isoform X1 n=1 Tax=Sesamum indicum TaxID=4182 RepID=A0A6I9U2Z7_SESIN|nr:uncharacterized protein At5g41620 isoform X1 [Sesamum indicum]XP_011093306.1 uncharacterized protein At5g41620 isoform X1 [Sesamum indicum]